MFEAGGEESTGSKGGSVMAVPCQLLLLLSPKTLLVLWSEGSEVTVLPRKTLILVKALLHPFQPCPWGHQSGGLLKKWRFSLEPQHFLPVLSHIFGVEETELSRGAGVRLSLHVVFGWRALLW